MTSISSSSLSLVSSATAAHLVQKAYGEYSAASVLSDEKAALNLGLVKEQDGNYGRAYPNVSAGESAAARSSSAVQSALASLTLGGN